MEKRYHTRQREELLRFLASDSERQLTIEEIAGQLPAMGKSTVYRLVRQLVEDGVLRRFVAGNNRKFLYQYAAGRDCCAHLHLKCVCCGKLIHLGNEVSQRMVGAISNLYNFQIDGAKTMLFGACLSCQNAEKRRQNGGENAI